MLVPAKDTEPFIDSAMSVVNPLVFVNAVEQVDLSIVVTVDPPTPAVLVPNGCCEQTPIS